MALLEWNDRGGHDALPAEAEARPSLGHRRPRGALPTTVQGCALFQRESNQIGSWVPPAGGVWRATCRPPHIPGTRGKAPTRQRGRASNEKPPRVAARGFFGAAVPGEGGCRAANVTSPTANRSAVAGGCKRFTMLGFLVLALREHDRHEHQQKRSHEGRQQ
jgi:hypothetical protein